MLFEWNVSIQSEVPQFHTRRSLVQFAFLAFESIDENSRYPGYLERIRLITAEDVSNIIVVSNSSHPSLAHARQLRNARCAQQVL